MVATRLFSWRSSRCLAEGNRFFKPKEQTFLFSVHNSQCAVQDLSHKMCWAFVGSINILEHAAIKTLLCVWCSCRWHSPAGGTLVTGGEEV